MEKVPTAESFLAEKFPEFEDLDNGNVWVNIEGTMVEFAMIHVEAALKAASEKYIEFYEGSVEDGELEKIKDSILDSYPLENIKYD